MKQGIIQMKNCGFLDFCLYAFAGLPLVGFT